MAKITLPDIAAQFASAAALNSRFQEIEDHLNDLVLYRENPEGEPNAMGQILDMNGYQIANLPFPVAPTDAVRLQDLESFDVTLAVVPQSTARYEFSDFTVGSGSTTFTKDATQAVGLLYLNGVFQEAGIDYTYTSTVITFLAELLPADVIHVVSGNDTGLQVTSDLVTYSPPFTGGTTRTVEGRLGDIVTAKDIGCTPALSAAANLALIEAGLDIHSTLVIPQDIPWDRDALIQPLRTMIIDNATGEHIYSNAVLSGGTVSRNHLTVTNARTGVSVAGMWIMPKGFPDPTTMPDTASIKIFHEDYDGLNAQDYRDGGLIARQDLGHAGNGIVNVNAKSNGNQTPFIPDISLGHQGGTRLPLRVMDVQPRVGVAGNFYAGGGLYTFEVGYPIWRAGIPVAQGQLFNQYGRIYEAQTAGTTGSTQPIHATYKQTVITVADTTGFIVGEIVRQGSGPNGVIDSIIDSTDIRLKFENAASIAGDWVSPTAVTGDDSLSSSNYASLATVNIDYDEASTSYKPFGTPVDGRTVSDGNISFRFLDDIKGNVPGNEEFNSVVMLANKDVVPVIGYAGHVAHFGDDALVYEDKSICFHRVATDDCDIRIRREADRLIIEAAKADGRVRIQADDDTAYFDVSNSKVQPVNCEFNYDSTAKSDGATTHDISKSNLVTVNDTAPTNFTGFTGGSTGQPVYMRFNTANTTLIDGTAFELPGGADFTPAANTAYQFILSTSAKATLVS